MWGGKRVKIKHPWYMTLIQYYILVLLVPMFVIMFLSFLGIYLVRSEVITANRIIIEQFRQEVDTKLGEFQQYNIFTQQEEPLNSLELEGGQLEPLQRFRLIQMNKNLSKVILTNPLVADYMIYMPGLRCQVCLPICIRKGKPALPALSRTISLLR